mmetsp:Transcript_126372/g.369239  ORF Transcript_126372/g.369239 Transcript_126372/m.369239 type:complete len:136 (+) Transcript_126372:69-476(+)
MLRAAARAGPACAAGWRQATGLAACRAVVGRGSNTIVQQLLEHLERHGRDVRHVDPTGATSGAPKTLAELPEDAIIDVVDLCANPAKFGIQVIEDCRKRGIQNVFIQPGAGSPTVEAKCKDAGIAFHRGCVLQEL